VESAERLREHPHVEHLHERLVALAKVIDQMTPHPGVRAVAIKQRWGEFRKALVPEYERLASSLHAFDIHVPSLRPSNHMRSVWHAMNGIVVMLAIQWVLTTPSLMLLVSGVALGLAWSMEISRRFSSRINDLLMWVFKHVAHPHEAWRINSATWYCTAMFVLALMGDPMVASIAVIVLGMADPAAAIVGRRWGRVSLLNGRTLEGSLTFVCVGTISAWALMAIFHPQPVMTAWILALVAGVSGALAELFCRRVDDNLAIPIVVSSTLMLMLVLLGQV
jgi:dolichol kinase